MAKYLKFLIALIFLQLSLSSLFAQNSLNIVNPNWGWYGDPGSIEDAKLAIRPKGIYMEYSLYLTFSTEGSYFSDQDSLEVELMFTLPENSIVHDSWLWIEDDIIRAEIMDEWTAGQIYNDIVGRNMDPSILFDRGYYYELRVFPIMMGQTRKVKITYLVPTNWNSNSVTTPLPINILKTSHLSVNKLDLIIYPNETWKNPSITELPEIEFTSKTDSVFGDFLYAEIDGSYLNESLNFSFKSPMQDGVYLATYEKEAENYYELAVLPSALLKTESSKNVMILVDYSSTNSSLTKSEILSELKTSLINNLTPADSFNIAFSKLDIERISDVWLPADSATIDQTFQNITDSNFGSYSNLPSLLKNGVEFFNDNGQDGIIVLMANTDDMMDAEPANELMSDITGLIDGEISFHIADFQNRNFNYVYIGNQYYEGNQYLYVNLSRITGGNYYRLRDANSYEYLLTITFRGIGGFISIFDLYTTIADGLCYGRYTFNINGSSAFLNVPIFQVGKFNGSTPFLIEANGIYEGNVFSYDIEILENEREKVDSTLKKMWVGQYIDDLEDEYQTNTIISEMINVSITNRVLSERTAFICLEPSQGGEVCYDCREDGGGSTDVETNDTTETSDSLSAVAYPNPFNSQTRIQVNLPSSISKENASFKIYNILGQLVKTFAEDRIYEGKFELTWDGKNDYGQAVSSGNYIFVAITPQQTYSIKLLLIK